MDYLSKGEVLTITVRLVLLFERNINIQYAANLIFEFISLEMGVKQKAQNRSKN